MNQKFVTVDEVQVAYLEMHPDKPVSIYFIHGNSGSAESWRRQLESESLSKYHLVAFDLPAHGNSSSLNKSDYDYNLPDLGRILAIAVGKIRNGRPFILVGLSLGTNILAELLCHNEMPVGIVLVGSCLVGSEYPMEKVFLPGTDLTAMFSDEAKEEELKSYSRFAFSSEGEGDWLRFANDFFAVKDRFRSRLFASAKEGKFNDQVAILKDKKLPTLVVFGSEEKICDMHYLDKAGLRLWQEKVFVIEKAGHLVNIDQPEALNQLLTQFVSQQFKVCHS